MSTEPDTASTGRPRASADHADSESIIAIPSVDPFYRAPAGFERAKPGTVLRSREVTLALFGVIRQKVSAWQLLYRTTSLDGAARVAVTTVVLPVGGRARPQRALLSYQCAIDAVSDRCFPSYVLRAGARAVGSVPQFEFMIILYALRRGWVLSLPDHEGMNGQWGAPIEPGYCTLDGVRAALSFEPLDLADTTPVALWGYSGGGLATSWAAEVAADYAPRTRYRRRCTRITRRRSRVCILPPQRHDLRGAARNGGGGLRRTYPELDRLVREHVAASGLEALSSLHRKTTVHAVASMVMHDLERHLDIPMADLLATPEMVQVFQDIQPGKSAPKFPLLVVQAVHDPMIDVDDVDGQVRRYRAAGANVTYIRDRLSEHLSLHPIAAPVTLDWLSDRFAGKPTDESSTNTVWSLAGSLPGLRGLLGLAVSTGRAFAGRIG
ncbi:lipase family protein [Rhodococcus sp. BS-15]|uniref:lipase family protein n=1 Tax=Rhodococcus sp. BS-15 TaxID=1304954 RepID=UPI000B133D38|nr:lipase family protein [Rhodococcus sp. BS-15]